ncbi:MAG TPA: hypothetical protein VFE51_18775 [Verrucomicrobiae bacterium]|nr:hypothetical protein [Verrucomicrobiae bacterium]
MTSPPSALVLPWVRTGTADAVRALTQQRWGCLSRSQSKSLRFEFGTSVLRQSADEPLASSGEAIRLVQRRSALALCCLVVVWVVVCAFVLTALWLRWAL